MINGTLLAKELREFSLDIFKGIKFVLLRHWSEDQWLVMPYIDNKYQWKMTSTITAPLLRFSRVIDLLSDKGHETLLHLGLKFIYGGASGDMKDEEYFQQWKKVIAKSFEIEDLFEAVYEDRASEILPTMVDMATGIRKDGIVYATDENDNVLRIATYVKDDSDGQHFYWEHIIAEGTPRKLYLKYDIF